MSDTHTAGAVPERETIDTQDMWDVQALYPTDALWESDIEALETLMAPLEAMQGTLTTAENVARFLSAQTELDRLAERVYVYAHLRADENTANTENQAREGRIRQLYADLSSRLAWARPELLQNPEQTLEAWLSEPCLEGHRYALKQLIRHKPHTLSAPEERLLAGASPIFAAPGEVFKLLTNADMTFPEITDADGNQQEMSQGRFVRFLQDRDRAVRREAFGAMYDTFGQVRNAVAATLRNHVKMHTFVARTRHHESALHAALSSDNIPTDVYNSLIAATHEALPAFHRYVDLRRRALALDHVDMYDMYVPIVPEVDMHVPFEEAAQWAIAACAPLGDDYVKVLRSAFEQRWIDKFECRGKRSGAYSSGCYDSLPYILLNYQGTLNDVFTLAHELGHSMHSWLANHTQPPQTAGYPIFIAEIASTANEGLLLHYLLEEHAGDERLRAYLINHFCNGFRGTVYRQTMFAEFEKVIHEMDAEGKPVTPDTLSDVYAKLNADFHGEAVQADARIGLEWARIPHFYYNFYVYKYATSLCASQIFVQRLLADATTADSYLDLLRAGGSADPLDLVSKAGVELLSRRTFEQAFTTFAQRVEELQDLLP
ncbi:MAG: oligoendopeptidase F [Lentisphaerae bacterium]|jgi:oligoendopeptidase F|nr:oligoendopeptidase F [Lentisphaerota bacterium]MBT5610754.1 oligoendopeptidase F [Lentisphaerota bacterium]MBT7060836.1 oligoendopeptidase F [Lentisphaerota bacterium]MBT7841275.1 oligoendopeptidase F [Lentisphaerota bacterium]